MKFETRAIQAASEPDPATGSISPPIHLSTTFEHGPAGESPHGHIYIRESNPTQSRLEEALAIIDGGEVALVFASGVAAGAAYLQALPAGSHVVLHTDLYYAFRTIAVEFLPRWGMTASFANMTKLDELRAAVTPKTKLVWTETPTNPQMQVVDLMAVADIAHGVGAKLLVDGTFATPALQLPLDLGADVVLHSTTKYLGGHSDVQGGALVFRTRDEFHERAKHIRHLLGAVGSPFASWMVLRGIRTLGCRMDRHSANALALAQTLSTHPGIDAVHYPGLPTHAGHAIAKRQMRAFGGMLSIQVAGGRAGALEVASRVKLFRNATSLGGVESLLEHRVSVEGPNTTTPDNLIRVSVGLEHSDDLVDDLTQALEGAAARKGKAIR